MGILSDLSTVKRGQMIDVECDNIGKNPTCKGRYQVKFQSIKKTVRSPFYCNDCSFRIMRYSEDTQEKLTRINQRTWSNPERRERLSQTLKKYYAENDDARKACSERSKRTLSNEDVRKKLSDSLKISKNTPKAKKEMSERSRMYWDTPEIRANIISKLRENAQRPEFRERLSEINRKRFEDNSEREYLRRLWDNPEFRAKMSEHNRRSMNRPEAKQRMSEIMKARLALPEEKKKSSERMKKIMANPAVREKQRLNSKKNWEDPAFRDREMTAIQRRMQDPVQREKILAAMALGRTKASRIKANSKIRENWQNPSIRSQIQEKAQKSFFKNGTFGKASAGQKCLHVLCCSLFDDVTINDVMIVTGKVPDIVIHSKKVVIEYDGWYWHQKKRGKDIEAIGLYLAAGYRTLRFFVKKQEDENNFDAAFYKKEIHRFIKSKRKFDIIEVE